MKYKITYMSGAGNLFTVIDNRNGAISNKLGSQLAPLLCNLNEINKFETEGLMLLENSSDYSFKCNFFNPDGSTGMMCGNGGRAIVNFALNLQVINKDDKDIEFEMASDIYKANFKDELVDLEMPNIKDEKVIELKVQGRKVSAYYVDNGSQHTVIRIDKLDNLQLPKLDINGYGREIRYNEIFGKLGSNANFYDVRNGIIHLRTYERGVEKETGACGTGAVATAITAVKESGLNFPVNIIPTSGEKLIVDKKIDLLGATKYHLIGPAVILEEREIEV
ncbi:diaminopimelate epimerase [bacterium]|nr:MAG: diaminopimelate epimerase [bacterium]